MNEPHSSPPEDGEQLHWLYRRETLPKFWLAGCSLLALTLAFDVFVDLHPKFGFADWWSFNAFYGFFTCLLMVVFAKWLAHFVKRPDDYYEAEAMGEAEETSESEVVGESEATAFDAPIREDVQ
jgi:hypothetical protein